MTIPRIGSRAGRVAIAGSRRSIIAGPWPRPTRSTPTGNWPNGAASRSCVDEYREQLAKILELDPNHEQARQALGHQKQERRWRSRDDVMAARGLVWYDGKYYTQHHIELLEQAKAAKQTDADWNNRLDRWRRWLTGRRQDRSDEALREIRAIRRSRRPRRRSLTC